MARIKPGTKSDARNVQNAIAHLRLARALLVSAGASKAAGKVRLALKSAEGAERHAWHRTRRTEVPQGCRAGVIGCNGDVDCTHTERWAEVYQLGLDRGLTPPIAEEAANEGEKFPRRDAEDIVREYVEGTE